MPTDKILFSLINFVLLSHIFYAHSSDISPPISNKQWLLIDDFEQPIPLLNWLKMDTDNNTQPYIKHPQVTQVHLEKAMNNHYLIKKPAADGVVGNRKAISITKLPITVKVGETFTFYTRIKVEYFPNNHSFGLTNLSPKQIEKQNYNAFEAMIRVTDKQESNGYQNNGTLMVMSDNKSYRKITHPKTGQPAHPISERSWYELWYVVNNAKLSQGGQSYHLYMRGGEFTNQTKVSEHGKFRMQREQALGYFMTISNTGSIKNPYGNGGLMYDDIYMAKGVELTTPSR